MQKVNTAFLAVEFLVSVPSHDLLALLWELGTLGIEERPDTLVAFFPPATDLSTLRAAYTCRVETLDPTTTLAPLGLPEPILAGDRFFIAPHGSKEPTPEGRIRLTIDAPNAFGSGRHETTQLVIEALERHLAPGALVIDAGCGSGILSAAAGALGAKTVIACDPHLDSAALTHHQVPTAHVFAGSIDSVRSGQADFVLANISARVIDLLSFHLTRILRPCGLLVLSGFIADRPPETFQPEEESALNDWRCWVCRPAPLSVSEEQSSFPALQPFSSVWW